MLAACEGDDLNLLLQSATPEPVRHPRQSQNDAAGDAGGFLQKVPPQLTFVKLEGHTPRLAALPSPMADAACFTALTLAITSSQFALRVTTYDFSRSG